MIPNQLCTNLHDVAFGSQLDVSVLDQVIVLGVAVTHEATCVVLLDLEVERKSANSSAVYPNADILKHLVGTYRDAFLDIVKLLPARHCEFVARNYCSLLNLLHARHCKITMT